MYTSDCDKRTQSNAHMGAIECVGQEGYGAGWEGEGVEREMEGGQERGGYMVCCKLITFIIDGSG